MKIVFLLPNRARVPVGGYKIVYEYANRLSQDGYQVEIVYPAILSTGSITFYKKMRSLLRYLTILIKCEYSCDSWFELEAGVYEKWVYHFSPRLYAAGDIVIATACQTAYFLMKEKNLDVKRFYFIQHYEDWVEKNILEATWKSDLHKIVIADWLMEKAIAFGTEAVLVQNGLNFDDFSISIPISDKNEQTLAMLWHLAENKGSMDGYEAICAVKKNIPALKAVFFGVNERPAFLPDWVTYYQRPSRAELSKIYNESSVFVAPSRTEGFGLTAAEAMQCGCAVAATDAGGFAQFCIQGNTALVSPVRSNEELVKNIIALLTDRELRLRIATEGNDFIQTFTWKRAYSGFLQALGLS